MKKYLIVPLLLFSLFAVASDYDIAIEEFTLENGLHVVLHQNNSAPNVVIGVKYHVGSKNEDPELTGFAHFFEHLLFHGTENIPKGEFDNIILEAGGYDNAYTSYDFTYYYEFLPAHEYKLGLWMEAERMLHPIITEEGVNVEREVVKEEKRMRYDNKPLGNAYYDIFGSNFSEHPYKNSIIGSMEHLNRASTDDFKKFLKTYYVPNNACLVVAGDIDVKATIKCIKLYFSDIPRGKEISRPALTEKRPGKEIIIEKQDSRINKTHVALSYFAVPESSKEAYSFLILRSLMSGMDGDSYLTKDITDKEGTACAKVSASFEDYEQAGAFFLRADVAKGRTKEEAIAELEAELQKIIDGPISAYDVESVQNSIKADYIEMNYSMESVANMLTTHHFSWGAASVYNDMIENYMAVTPASIQAVAKKYFRTENRTVTVYYKDELAKN